MVDPTIGGLTDLAGAIGKYAPVVGSPALGAAEVLSGVVADIRGVARSATFPTMGAIEAV
jgi:hypothetical protein